MHFNATYAFMYQLIRTKNAAKPPPLDVPNALAGIAKRSRCNCGQLRLFSNGGAKAYGLSTFLRAYVRMRMK